ncbi:MAG: MarR family winged helix-turn-helix transcriptional regulator [Proteobacteria bacterium]|nr:MarR family winged helix-turn-helix transcriptional regulator [Pseudomonadota bacterium]
MNEKLTIEERIATNRLYAVLEELGGVHPNMTVAQLKTLVAAALNPGSTVTELGKLTGTTLSSASRHVDALGPLQATRKIGMDLVTSDYDALNRRRKVVQLTADGYRLLRAVLMRMAGPAGITVTRPKE